MIIFVVIIKNIYGELMDLKNIETFIYVAEQNSFTKAAEKLGYTQSAVSFQIKQLENSLNTVLFERINHKIKLTPEGHRILALAHKMAAISEDIKKTAADKQRLSGSIRIAMADSLCNFIFWDSYSNFHAKYPEIALKIISAGTEDMFRLAAQNDVDLIFTLDRHFYDSGYIIANEFPVNIHFVAAANHPLAEKESITLNDLLTCPFILTEKGMSYRRILEEYFSDNSVEVKPFLEIGNTNLICHLVEENIGISFLPDFVTEKYVQAGKLKRLNTTLFNTEIWIQILYHRDKWVTNEMKCVMDYIGSIL